MLFQPRRAGRPPLTPKSWYARYGAALLLIAAALGIRLVLDPWFGDHVPFIALFPAVAIAVWYAGVGPSVAAGLLGVLAASYFFVTPRMSLALGSTGLILLGASYFLACGLIILFGVLARRRAELAERSADAHRRVTEAHKRAEERLRQSEARLREADRRKDEFLAMLGHELRNPLAPIATAVQYLKLKSPNDAPLESGLAIIERQAAVMARLVDDLLDLSRLSRGRIELRHERVDLAVAIEDALAACRPSIESARHELLVRLPAERVQVDGDLVRLSQIVANLLNNAAKYTPPGGRIELVLETHDGEASVEVTDTGIGIPPDMLSRIFEMFTQLDVSTERTRGGLGIGLTLARQLAEMHGGRIEAISEGLGRGSTFSVCLPLAGAAAERPEDVLPEPAATRPLRVLVADDNVDAAHSLGLLLETQHHEVRVVHDGLEAVEAAAAFRPELVLLDIAMPRLDGYEAARRIRALAGGQGMRLVAITGWGRAEDRQRCLDAGFDEHVTKPVDACKLERFVARVADAAEQVPGGTAA